MKIRRTLNNWWFPPYLDWGPEWFKLALYRNIYISIPIYGYQRDWSDPFESSWKLVWYRDTYYWQKAIQNNCTGKGLSFGTVQELSCFFSLFRIQDGRTLFFAFSNMYRKVLKSGRKNFSRWHKNKTKGPTGWGPHWGRLITIEEGKHQMVKPFTEIMYFLIATFVGVRAIPSISGIYCVKFTIHVDLLHR